MGFRNRIHDAPAKFGSLGLSRIAIEKTIRFRDVTQALLHALVRLGAAPIGFGGLSQALLSQPLVVGEPRLGFREPRLGIRKPRRFKAAPSEPAIPPTTNKSAAPITATTTLFLRRRGCSRRRRSSKSQPRSAAITRRLATRSVVLADSPGFTPRSAACGSCRPKGG